MAITAYSDVIEEASGKISLFKNDSELDRFLEDVLTDIKDRVGAAMAAIFIYDAQSHEFIFRVGIDSEGILDRLHCTQNGAPVRFSLDDSEVGRAFREGRVLKKLVTESETEHALRSKLLVPIARGPLKIGVLVLADSKDHAFSNLDQSEMLSSTSRLGDLLENASLLLESAASEKSRDRFKAILGRIASGGIVQGTALPFWPDRDEKTEISVPTLTKPAELKRFDEALARTLRQLENLKNTAASEISEMGALIFTAHLLMLKDRSFTGAMRSLIEAGDSAAKAIRTVVDKYAARFSKMSEIRLAEKSQDVRDLGFRLTTNLDGRGDHALSYKGHIALARHIYPSELLRLAVEGISGIVLMGTGVTAHISILARSLDVPVLITDDKSLLDINGGTPLCLDASKGKLLVNPPADVLQDITELIIKSRAVPDFLTLKGKTADNVNVQVSANVNILKDAEEAKRQGAEGIGLYRSEFPFILKNDFLSEEQQYHIYRSIVLTQNGKPVILRTADIGGDKILQGREQSEENPFIGVRGIRFSLANRQMFREQLRAMLRAGEGAELSILLPMVSDVEEVVEAKAEIALAIDNLKERGVAHNSHPRIGSMIELPSAALAVKELVTELDFLSIGTNDLTMYLLAVDRTNDNLSHLYKNHHPAVLRVLKSILIEAGEISSGVSVCGDAAADPVLIPFFVGIGIRNLSVSPALVESVKKRLSQFTLKQAGKIAAEMLAIKRVSEMERYLEAFNQLYPAI